VTLKHVLGEGRVCPRERQDSLSDVLRKRCKGRGKASSSTPTGLEKLRHVPAEPSPEVGQEFQPGAVALRTRRMIFTPGPVPTHRRTTPVPPRLERRSWRKGRQSIQPVLGPRNSLI